MPISTQRPCPHCGGTANRPLKPFRKHHLVRCTACHFVFTAWWPSLEELSAYYGSYPAITEVSPVTLTRYQELLDHFAPYRRTGQLIDVGCGAGLFLQQAAQRGWSVHGTEFGQQCVEECRKRQVAIIEGPLDTANYEEGSFDVVCSFEVIEHLTDPAAELDRFHRLLRPGGLLYVTTPNFDCLSRRMAPSDWRVANYPEHLMYFTSGSMDRMMRAHGFRKRWSSTTGFSFHRWMVRKKVGFEGRAEALAAQENIRNALETRLVLRLAKHLLNGTLNALRLGESLKAAYVKV